MGPGTAGPTPNANENKYTATIRTLIAMRMTQTLRRMRPMSFNLMRIRMILSHTASPDSRRQKLKGGRSRASWEWQIRGEESKEMR